jgi:hypothetical protein
MKETVGLFNSIDTKSFDYSISLYKIKEIKAALQDEHLVHLRQLGQSPLGFVNDRQRRKVWPLLLHCSHVSKEVLVESIGLFFIYKVYFKFILNLFINFC